MKRRTTEKAGWGKILEAWQPPPNAGDPIGCVATSYTFSPLLFEEECLARFLNLETDANEDGAAYLIEREEKLSQVICAAALVDQRHARGVRSLRWDLLSARLPGEGVLHAKMSLLLWTRTARLIVASGNITEDGYRRNHEVFGVLDFGEGSTTPPDVLGEGVATLRQMVTFAEPRMENPGPAVARWNSFLDTVVARTRDWRPESPSRTFIQTRLITILPGGPNAFETIRQSFPSSSPPSRAFVTSPFFDPPEAPNRPARELWGLLRQRGEAFVEYQVVAEEVPGEEGRLLHAPKSLLESMPLNRASVSTGFAALKLEPNRPLHAKSLWLENDDWLLYMVGSSNFTSPGLGFGNNAEMNLAYVVRHSRDPKASEALCAAVLPAREITDLDEVRFQASLDDGDDGPADVEVLLPAFFTAAHFGTTADGDAFVELWLVGDPPPGWTLYVEEEPEAYYTAAGWQAAGAAATVRLPWTRSRPPCGFKVQWDSSEGAAWWPVNAQAPSALPPPSELRDLPLEVLIEILSSARPLHVALRTWLRRRDLPGTERPVELVDPHKRVDTTKFLLQRTRRMSWALSALRQRLERPVPSKEALNWRLRGPVGVKALADALLREAVSSEERWFLFAELALELSRVTARSAPGCLPVEEVQGALGEIVSELQKEAAQASLTDSPQLQRYVADVFGEVCR